jgi:hypothetical protein
LSRYRDISVVQPGEKAAGKNAMTTDDLPLSDESVAVFAAGRPPSGAGSS